MTNAQEYAEGIAARLPLIKSGTLRVWGEWFGRPYDNIHSIIGASADEEKLVLLFNEGESLSVHDPDRGTFNEKIFQIEFATRVRWEWYFYGKDRLPENLQFLDYLLGPDGWSLETNWRFNQPLNGTPTGPAAELL